MKAEHPNVYKFETKDARLIIHETRWHDLGQYYCVVGGVVKTVYLLYQRPIILFAEPKGKLEKWDLGESTSITDPATFMDRLTKLSEGDGLRVAQMSGLRNCICSSYEQINVSRM